MERSEGPNLELMAQEPYLKPRVVSAPLSHPQASILDLVPDNMRPILGPIISDVDVVRPDIGQLNVALKSAGVDSESGISGCLGEGMAGGKLALQYLLSRSSGLGDLVRFSEQDEEQTFLEQELFSRYGSAPVMSMVGTGDYVAKQLIELLQKHSMAAHAARYHPTVAGEARQLEWDSTSQQRVLSVIVPFPKVQPLMEQVETPEALLERAHVFFTDETYVVDLEQALADQRHGLDLVTENDDDDLKGIIEVLENDDDLTPWTLLAVNLVSEKVDLGSLAKYLQENELFKGLVASSVINVAFLKVDNHIEPEQLYEVCREWQLPNEDATYLARLINGNADIDVARTKPMLLKIAQSLLEERAAKRRGSGFSRFSADGVEPPTLYHERRSFSDVEIFNLKEGIGPIFRKMFGQVGIDIRSAKEQLEDLDLTILPRLQRWGAWREDQLGSFNVVSLQDLKALAAPPWNLSAEAREVIFYWVNGRGFDQDLLQAVLLDLYARYEDIMGHPAIVVLDVHRDRGMDAESLDFWEKVVSNRRVASQPMLYTAVPFPGEEAEIGLDVLMAKLVESLSGEWEDEKLEKASKWAKIIGRHPEYRESLKVLKQVIRDISKSPREDFILNEAHCAAHEREQSGSPVAISSSEFLLLALLPGFLEQGRRAAADTNMEQAEFSFNIAEHVRDYLLAAISDEGFDQEDDLAIRFAEYNDDILLLAADYHIGESRRKGKGAPLQSIYEAIKIYLKLVGAHKMAVSPKDKQSSSEGGQEVFKVEGQQPPRLEVAQQGVLNRLGATWVGKLFPNLRKRAESPPKVADSAPVLTAEFRVSGPPPTLAPKGLSERAFFEVCSLLEERRSLHRIATVSPLAATPAMLYALAERYYLKGDEESYEAVVDICYRVQYGYANQAYGEKYWGTVTQSAPQGFDPGISGAPGYAPILRFGDRYYLEILRLGVQAAHQVFKKRYGSLTPGVAEKAESIYREIVRKFRLVHDKFPGEMSPFRQYNAELVQGQVALEIDRNFDLAVHHFRKAARLAVDRDGKPLPGQAINARRSKHLSVESMRQWVDCHFWEQEQEEPSEEMLESALNSLYQTFLAESQVIEEEKLSEKQSKPHLAEYQMTLMQGLASLIALKEQYGEAATWDRYPDLMAQCSFDDKERIMNYDQNTEINLREIHDELLPSFLDLFELSPPMWTAIAGQISNYVKMLSEKAPDSVLLAEMGHQWKGLTEKLERQLKERPVLD